MSDQPQGAAQGRPSHRQAARKSHTGAYIRLGVIGFIVIFVLVFVFQNTQRINLNFLSADFKAPLWLMLLLVLVVGVIIGYFLGVRRRKTRRQV